MLPRQYYHSYLNNLISFLVPEDKKKKVLEQYDIDSLSSLNSDNEYIILSDVLGHVPDIQDTLSEVRSKLALGGRVIITQYNQLWEPILNLATTLRLRNKILPQNWIGREDIGNMLALAGFEVIKQGSKLLIPFYIPWVSAFLNKIVANLPVFNRLGIINFLVARPSSEIQGDASVSIVVPARNEAGTISKIIAELPIMGTQTEIIFVEGNSTDNTLETIRSEVQKYSGPKKISYAIQGGKGKGDAVRKGFEMAQGDILMIYDADMTVPPEELKKFYTALVENRGDFINGSRLVYPMEKQSMRTANFIGNKFFSVMFSWILDQRIKDTLCGTKVLWKKDYESIKKNRSFFGDFDPFGDFDLLFGAAKLNLKIIDLPVHYKNRIYGETNISRWSHGVLLLRMVLFAMKKIKFI